MPTSYTTAKNSQASLDYTTLSSSEPQFTHMDPVSKYQPMPRVPSFCPPLRMSEPNPSAIKAGHSCSLIKKKKITSCLYSSPSQHQKNSAVSQQVALFAEGMFHHLENSAKPSCISPAETWTATLNAKHLCGYFSRLCSSLPHEVPGLQ